MREGPIVYQVGDYWVGDYNKQYTVYKDGNVVAKADSSYPYTEDGLSLAKARVDFLYKYRNTKAIPGGRE